MSATRSRLRFRLHLAAIAAVSVACGASLYAHAHAHNFRTFGDFRRSHVSKPEGKLFGPPSAEKPMPPRRSFTPTEVEAVLDSIPNDTLLREVPALPNRRDLQQRQILRFGQTDFYNLMLCEHEGYLLIQSGRYPPKFFADPIVRYHFTYGPGTEARLKAVIARLNPPPAQPK